MIRWRVMQNMFMTSSVVVEKGFIYKEEAEAIADELNIDCDAYTHYYVEAYQSENILKFGNIKLKK